MKYFAYGSNMNHAHMRRLCPDVAFMEPFRLEGFRLVFKEHADIVQTPGCSVHGGLWQITEVDEIELDSYEGYPYYYDKYYQDDIMFYQMLPAYTDLKPPKRSYLKTIVQGYREFGLTQADFEESLGVKQLGLAERDFKEMIGVERDELARLFSADKLNNLCRRTE